jgi:HD-GYP domain-containing protein (c-di-GMP phosphodiesterase class II)
VPHYFLRKARSGFINPSWGTEFIVEKEEVKKSYFSVSIDLIILGDEIPYNLYINSSANAKREKFIRIFPIGGILLRDDLKRFKTKYFQLYIAEEERDAFLKSLVSSDEIPDEQKTQVIKDSAINYLTKVFDDEKEFTTDMLEETIEGCKDSVEHLIDVVQDYDVKELQQLIGNLSFHDFYTFDHSVNVSMYCISLYKTIKPNATKEELTNAGLGGLLHDLGKINIPTEILNKAGKLSEEEFKVIQTHPEKGGILIDQQNADCPGVDFALIKRAITEHHENFNGTGYPNKIAGDNIHVIARIVSISDFFDALTTKRSYHEVLSPPDALAIMEKTSGRKIDPALFKVFVGIVQDVGNKGKQNVTLPDSFDPCQPQNTLPFEAIKVKKQDSNIFGKDESQYGSVKSDTFVSKKDKKAAS